MKTVKTLLLASLVAAPFAAGAESPNAVRFFDEPGTRTRAEVRAEARYAIAGNLGEALGAFDMMAIVKNPRSRDVIRRELAQMPAMRLFDGGGAN
jgi:hypothetical protein